MALLLDTEVLVTLIRNKKINGQIRCRLSGVGAALISREQHDRYKVGDCIVIAELAANASPDSLTGKLLTN